VLETGLDGRENFGERGEVPVMQRQTPCQLPDPFNRCQLRAVWREEQQRQVPPVFSQQWLEHVGMVVLGVVQHDDDALATTSMTQ